MSPGIGLTPPPSAMGTWTTGPPSRSSTPATTGSPQAWAAATAVLLARHGKRALSYVLVVRVQMGVAVTHLADFKKAYFGLKAIP